MRIVPALLAVLACRPDDAGPADSEPASDADADTDTDTDADSDTDTDTEPPPITGLCLPLPPATGPSRTLSPADDLAAEVASAAPGDVLLLSAGTYDIGDGIVIEAEGLTLRGATGVAADIVLEGKYAPFVGISVRASDVTVADLTVRQVFRDGVRVESDVADVSGTLIANVAVEDALGRGIVAAHGAHAMDLGTVQCSSVRLTADGRDRLALCDLAGIDLDGVADWTVTQSTVEGIWCPEGDAATGVRVINGARNVALHGVRVHDAALGFQVGLGESGGRVWDDAPCGGLVAQVYGVTVHNSWSGIYDPLIFASRGGAAANFLFEAACDVSALHLTAYTAEAPTVAAIQHRYPATTGTLGNAIATAGILRTDGSEAVLLGNLENAPGTSFLDVRNGDLHLVPSAGVAIDAGVFDFAALVPTDIDGQARVGAPDLGADEVLPPS
jgi:hypothetical protein